MAQLQAAVTDSPWSSLSEPAAHTMSAVPKSLPTFQNTPCTPMNAACFFSSSDVM